MERRTKILTLRSFIIAAVWLMPIGSPGDKVALIFFSLFFTAAGMMRAFRELMHRSPPLMTAMYSSVAIAGTWANSRYRLGGGPFHLAAVSDWRGYPLPYQEWGFVSNGTWWCEFCWTGAVVDTIVIAIGFYGVTHFIGTKIAQALILLLSGFAAAFTWLNIETWLYGVPAVFIQSPNNIEDAIRQVQTETLGFPFVYLFSNGQQSTWALVANIASGIAGWLFLYVVLRWARRDSANQ